MKTRKFSILIAISMLAVAGSNAVAHDKWLGDRGDNWEEHIVSTKSRTQVIAELKDARARGIEAGANETSYPNLPAVGRSRTREDVQAELVESIKRPAATLDYIGGA